MRSGSKTLTTTPERIIDKFLPKFPIVKFTASGPNTDKIRIGDKDSQDFILPQGDSVTLKGDPQTWWGMAVSGSQEITWIVNDEN